MRTIIISVGGLHFPSGELSHYCKYHEACSNWRLPFSPWHTSHYQRPQTDIYSSLLFVVAHGEMVSYYLLRFSSVLSFCTFISPASKRQRHRVCPSFHLSVLPLLVVIIWLSWLSKWQMCWCFSRAFKLRFMKLFDQKYLRIFSQRWRWDLFYFFSEAK